jgi:hypothetical protein
MAEIKTAAEKLGLSATPASFNSPAEVDPAVPLIVGIRQPPAAATYHFVALFGGAPSHVQILDYPWQPRVMPREAFGRIWDGKGLYVSRGNASRDAAMTHFGNRAIGAAAGALAVVGLLFFCRSRRRQPRHA